MANTRSAEHQRLAEADSGLSPWRDWGPYVAERAWGTVREDYGGGVKGTTWKHFPHDHARSRAYRWSDDGLAAICDKDQTFCCALAFWNGVDPILKERIFGLDNFDGNHGEDAKEYWWYLDSTPTHSWMRWRYHYPQHRFPYEELVTENQRRSRRDPEYDLIDTGVFAENRFWQITAEFAKVNPYDLLINLDIVNRGPEESALHVLPMLWFRNTWAWGTSDEIKVPQISTVNGYLYGEHPTYGQLIFSSDSSSTPLFCDNETNSARLWNQPGLSVYPKDGINDYVVHHTPTVNPEHVGTKASLHHYVTVAAGQKANIRLRLHKGSTDNDFGPEFDELSRRREQEANEFYATLASRSINEQDALIVRQACAGLLWGKQYYHYNVRRWLAGDSGRSQPSANRITRRNANWWHFDSQEVISMPDPWEYPWFAAWDLAFQCIALAHTDPSFSKEQLLLLFREWYMHPNGQIPAYEWNFSNVNPPVQAWAALRVFTIDGSRDYEFLEKLFHKLLINFTWWVNRKDREGNNIFEGGFLGLDNIGPFNRSDVPGGLRLEQSDATAWMALYCLSMFEIALLLARRNTAYEDMATKFFEHFAYIGSAAEKLWHEEDGFYYDILDTSKGNQTPLRIRSIVGLLPLTAVTLLTDGTVKDLPNFAERASWFIKHRPEYAGVIGASHKRVGSTGQLMAVVSRQRLGRILSSLLDEREFLSPYGIRSMSRRHLEKPFVLAIDGAKSIVNYEPGEAETTMYGGNSNWRGPVWFPVNFLVIEALRTYGRYWGSDFTMEYPTGSGKEYTLTEIANDIGQRLINLFRRDADGRRPVLGDVDLFQNDVNWQNLLPFHEYFHGDNGVGLGASHQTGWTALVADLILRQS